MRRTELTELELEGPKMNAEEPSNVLEFSATLRELRKNLDPELVKQRQTERDETGKIRVVDYVEWHTVADILDESAPNWTHAVKDIRQMGDFAIVTVAITVDGVTREGIGTGPVNSEIGIKKAEHDALKRAAVKFGIARDLYKRESEEIEAAPKPSSKEEALPADPVARSLSELVTARQLGLIRAIARELEIDMDKEANSILGCRTAEMTRRAASHFIEHLRDMQRTNIQPPMRIAS